jgi:hypothetical protein
MPIPSNLGLALQVAHLAVLFLQQGPILRQVMDVALEVATLWLLDVTTCFVVASRWKPAREIHQSWLLYENTPEKLLCRSPLFKYGREVGLPWLLDDNTHQKLLLPRILVEKHAQVFALPQVKRTRQSLCFDIRNGCD